MAKKVGQQNKEKKVKEKGRHDFPLKDVKMLDETGKLVSAVNKDGLLVAVPKEIKDGEVVKSPGYDFRIHKPLTKGNFADMATYLEFQGYVARQKANRLIALAEDRGLKADRLRKFGDEDTRKKAMKIARMREQLAQLEKQLTSEGIDVSTI